MDRKMYEKALLDPSGVFGTPEDVAGDDTLSRDQKIEILRRWEQDAEGLATAQAEGMDGGDAISLRRVAKALETV